MSAPPRISATMALDALSDAQKAVDDARYALREALDERDTLIQNAASAKLPHRTIARTTGLHPQRIKDILMRRLQHSADPNVGPL